MRLVVCDCVEDDVKHALSHLKVREGVSVSLNPQWLTPAPDENLWVACGGPAVKMMQAAGWMPKKGGVEANRGKLWTNIQPDGWTNPVALGVTYAPQVRQIEVADFVKLETDLAMYRRFERTGSMDAVLGHYDYVPDLSGVIAYLKRKHEATGQPVELALDTETEGLDPFNPDKNIVCVQATAEPGLTDIVYTLGMSWAYIQKVIIPQLEWIAEQPWIRVIGANFKYDLLWFRVKWGLNLSKRFAFDTCNGGSLVDENRPNTLNLHAKLYAGDLGGYDDAFNATHDKSNMAAVPKSDLLSYAGGDTDACLRSYRKIREELLSDNVTKSGRPAKNSLASVYLNIVHPTLRALHTMENTGFCVDVERFDAFGADLENRMHEQTKMALKHLPKNILDKHGGPGEDGGAPLSKPKMIADFLFSPQGLNLQPTVKTEKTGAPSTSEYHLAQFKDHPDAGPLIEAYLDYKSASKMHGTYYVGFKKHLRSDNRWHASYIIHKQGSDKDNEQAASGTVTGRGSATAPAFQCVVGGTEIQTPDGIRRARDLIDPVMGKDSYNPFREHELTIAGRYGWETTSNVFRSWRTDLVRIRLSCGNELTCTPEHPVLLHPEHRDRPGEWKCAKDLKPGHVLKIPEAVPRGKATPEVASVPDEALEALGVLFCEGRVETASAHVYLEVPVRFADLVYNGAKSVVPGATLDWAENDEGPCARVCLPLTQDLPSRAALWLLWLPGATDAVPEYRGTEKYLPVLRGMLHTTKWQDKSLNRYGFNLYVHDLQTAHMVQREAILDGCAPPLIRTTAPGSKPRHRYSIKIKPAAAYHALISTGLLPEGSYKPGKTTRPKRMRIGGNRVLDVESAPAQYVYDFTLPETHAFRANGLIVHNTVPKHSYWGKRLRECMVAPDGHVIVARDYSQGELKVAACWAGEGKMIDAYLNGIDLHTLTAGTVNGMTYEEAMFLKGTDPAAYKALRQNGKAGNFGLIYGMQAYGFMMYADQVYGVKLTLEEAEAMRDAFFDLYPGLPFWHDRQIAEALQCGYVRSPFGRLRHLPNINSPIKSVRKKAQNQAINSPIQATLVDMLWWSMAIMERDRPELVIPCGQIHDQGLWYVPEHLADEAIAYTGEVMENLPFRDTFGWNPELKFTSDAEVGLNLADLKEVA